VTTKVSPDRTSSTKSMSQPKISASATAVVSFAPAAWTASKSERSICPRTVRLRISSGFCSTSGLKDTRARGDTLSVWLSLSRRSSPNSWPSRWMKRSASPGRRLFQARTQARQSAQRCEVGEIEFQASENAVQGCRCGDDHIDRRECQLRFGEPGGPPAQQPGGRRPVCVRTARGCPRPK